MINRYVIVKGIVIKTDESSDLELIPIWSSRLSFHKADDEGGDYFKIDMGYERHYFLSDMIYDVSKDTLSAGIELDMMPDPAKDMMKKLLSISISATPTEIAIKERWMMVKETPTRYIIQEGDVLDKTYYAGWSKQLKKDDIGTINSSVRNEIGENGAALHLGIFCWPENKDSAVKIITDRMRELITKINQNITGLADAMSKFDINGK